MLAAIAAEGAGVVATKILCVKAFARCGFHKVRNAHLCSEIILSDVASMYQKQNAQKRVRHQRILVVKTAQLVSIPKSFDSMAVNAAW